MAESIVVSGLVSKHREIAGLIEHHRREIGRLTADLHHVVATAKLFAPELDLRSLKPKSHRERNQFFRAGETPRFILDTLRKAGTALTSRQLALQVVGSKGLEGTSEMAERVQKSLHVALKTLTDRGVLVEGPMEGQARTWRIA